MTTETNVVKDRLEKLQQDLKEAAGQAVLVVSRDVHEADPPVPLIGGSMTEYSSTSLTFGVISSGMDLEYDPKHGLIEVPVVEYTVYSTNTLPGYNLGFSPGDKDDEISGFPEGPMIWPSAARPNRALLGKSQFLIGPDQIVDFLDNGGCLGRDDHEFLFKSFNIFGLPLPKCRVFEEVQEEMKKEIQDDLLKSRKKIEVETAIQEGLFKKAKKYGIDLGLDSE